MRRSKLLYSAIALSAIFFVSFSTIARPEGFELIGSIPSSNGLYYTRMAPQGDYIAMGDQRSPGVGIDIIYVGDPENMIEVGHVHTGHMTYQLAWSGNYIYSPASWDGLFVYDVTDLDNIVLVADTSFGESMHVVAIRGDIAIVGGSNNLYSIDIRNPYSPQVIWSSNALGCSYLVLGDSVAYAYKLYNDVILIDISDPESPQEISRFRPLDVNGLCPSQDERYLYLTGQRDGIIIYDIGDPESPRLISQTPLPYNDWCIDVCVSEKYPHVLFVSAYIDGLWAVDVSDPEQPVPLHHYRPPAQDHYVMSYHDILFHTIYNSLLAFEYTPEGTDIDDQYPEIATEFSLSQNYPNPFNAATIIEYSLPSDGYTILEIYDIVGRKIETLRRGIEIAGQKSITWDARDFPSGIYFYKLSHKDRTLAKPLIFVK